MSLEENKEKTRGLYQAMNGSDFAALEELMDPAIVNNDPGLPPLPPGIEGFKALVNLLHAGFPDGKFVVVDLVAEGDYVAARWTFSGTHQGEFAGVPATGKFVSVGGSVIHRYANGKSAEHWALWDVLGMLRQMGAIPASSPS
jgi:steroid delta-isomerase-like uncharacterized protein